MHDVGCTFSTRLEYPFGYRYQFVSMQTDLPQASLDFLLQCVEVATRQPAQ